PTKRVPLPRPSSRCCRPWYVSARVQLKPSLRWCRRQAGKHDQYRLPTPAACTDLKQFLTSLAGMRQDLGICFVSLTRRTCSVCASTARYYCAAEPTYLGRKASWCQSAGGRELEKAVLAEVFAVLEPAALAATAQALAGAQTARAERLKAFELAV